MGFSKLKRRLERKHESVADNFFAFESKERKAMEFSLVLSQIKPLKQLTPLQKLSLKPSNLIQSAKAISSIMLSGNRKDNDK